MGEREKGAHPLPPPRIQTWHIARPRKRCRQGAGKSQHNIIPVQLGISTPTRPQYKTFATAPLADGLLPHPPPYSSPLALARSARAFVKKEHHQILPF